MSKQSMSLTPLLAVSICTLFINPAVAATCPLPQGLAPVAPLNAAKAFLESQGFHAEPALCEEDADFCGKVPEFVQCKEGATRAEGRCALVYIKGNLRITARTGMIWDLIDNADGQNEAFKALEDVTVQLSCRR